MATLSFVANEETFRLLFRRCLPCYRNGNDSHRSKRESRIHTFFNKQNKPTALYTGILLVALVGYLDYVTGFEFSISFLYLVPISLVTWYVDSREFDQQLNAELRQASRSKRPLSLEYIDLDDFKQVNDQLGGEKFAILFPSTGQAGAKCILQRLQCAFLKRMAESQTSVTLNAGVISLTCLPDPANELIHQADTLMYQAKAGGKNNVLFVES